MNEQPLVSIFMPYYNDEKFLGQAIESILTQTYRNWELFLFNHASTDNSKEIAHSYKDNRIRHIDAEKNLGAGSGYNLKICLPYMNGKYIKLLCADDVLKENALDLLVNKLEANPDKDIIFADMDFVDEQLVSLNVKWSTQIHKVDFVSSEKETLLKIFQGYSHLAYPSALIKMDALKSINIDPIFIMLFDVSLWLKLLIKGKKHIFLNQSVINYRISNNQLSSIANAQKASKIGWFELSMLLNLYYEIKDIDLIKYLCPCQYSSMLQKGDEKFIPFILSYFFASITQREDFAFFKDQIAVRELFGNTRLYELFQNEEYRRLVEDKFNFGIKEFRDVYSYMLKPSLNFKFGIKDKIYNKQAKNLQILQLLYLIIRKILNLINPTYYKHKFKKNKNKQYTV